jgi:hypothetical protein
MHEGIEYVPEKTESELRQMYGLPEQKLESSAPVAEGETILSSTGEINELVQGIEVEIAALLRTGESLTQDHWRMHQGTADKSLADVNAFLSQELNNNS